MQCNAIAEVGDTALSSSSSSSSLWSLDDDKLQRGNYFHAHMHSIRVVRCSILSIRMYTRQRCTDACVSFFPYYCAIDTVPSMHSPVHPFTNNTYLEIISFESLNNNGLSSIYIMYYYTVYWIVQYCAVLYLIRICKSKRWYLPKNSACVSCSAPRSAREAKFFMSWMLYIDTT